ncbi:MAG TPA: GNAT family N-acetyltransferase [Polyangiaceae bacterium]
MNLDALGGPPLLETERFRLRALVPEDADALLQVFGDEEAMRFYDRGVILELGEARVLIATLNKRREDRLGIRWAIAAKSDGAVVGTIGYNAFVASADRATLGYDVARAHWGKGVATEAVRAAVAWGHATLGLHRIEAVVMIGNERSTNVLRKAGFREEGLLRGYGRWKAAYHDLRMFSHLPPDP